MSSKPQYVVFWQYPDVLPGSTVERVDAAVALQQWLNQGYDEGYGNPTFIGPFGADNRGLSVMALRDPRDPPTALLEAARNALTVLEQEYFTGEDTFGPHPVTDALRSAIADYDAEHAQTAEKGADNGPA